MKNRIFATLLACFLAVTSFQLVSAENTEPQHNEVLKDESQLNAALTLIQDNVQVGEDVILKLEVHYQYEFENKNNYVLEIVFSDLIQNKSLTLNLDDQSLKINGISPSYDNNSNTLRYELNNLSASFNQVVLLSVSTNNGSNIADENLKVSLFETVNQKKTLKNDVTVNFTARKNIATTNKLRFVIDEDNNQREDGLRVGDIAVYNSGFSILKDSIGSLSPDFSKPVEFEYRIPLNSQYISNTSGVDPIITKSSTEQILTWNFSDYTEKDIENYIIHTFEIRVKVSEGEFNKFDDFETRAVTTAHFIDGKSLTEDQNSKTSLMPKKDNNEDILSGGLYNIGFFGPLDEIGGIQPASALNNNPPTVYGVGTLAWNIYGTPNSNTNPYQNMDSYDLFFHPDQNLNIETIELDNYRYRPNTQYPNLPMSQTVLASVSVLYSGESSWTQLQSGLVQGSKHTLKELGLDRHKNVLSIWVHFYTTKGNEFTDTIGKNSNLPSSHSSIPAGFTVNKLRFETTVKPGYIGTIKSEMGYASSGYNTNVNDNYVSLYYNMKPDGTDNILRSLKMGVDMEPYKGSDLIYRYAIPKTANVIHPTEGKELVINSYLNFAHSNDNSLNIGNHTLHINLENNLASSIPLKAPFIGYLTLPQGIDIDTEKPIEGLQLTLINENLKYSGKKLYKVELENDTIIPRGETAVAKIPVIVNDRVATLFKVEFTGFLNDDFKIHKTDNPANTQLVIQKDLDDLNENNNTEEKTFVATTILSVPQQYEFMTDTLLALDLSNQFASTVSHNKNQSIIQRMQINNLKDSTIHDLDIISILPRKNDNYLLINETKGSELDYFLTKEITLDNKHQQWFDIFYTTDEVVSYIEGVTTWVEANEVGDWNTVTAFRLVKKDRTSNIYESVISIDINLSNNINIDQANDVVYSSYVNQIVKINNLDPIESIASRIDYQSKPEEPEHPIPPVDPKDPVNPKDPVDHDSLPSTGQSSVIYSGLLITLFGCLIIKKRSKIYS